MKQYKRYIHAKPTAKSSTGVLGVGTSAFVRDGKLVRYFTAFCGRRVRRFNTTRLGADQAFRRALAARAEYERSIA